jgi:lysophospholipase L1-like esterase/fibronectin type 3 domain-containing protein
MLPLALLAGLALTAKSDPIIYADASDPNDPQISYDEDPYLYPNLPQYPTVIYPESGAGALTGTTDPYAAQAPVVQTSEPDTYSRPAPHSWGYTPPIDPPGPYFTNGVPLKFDFGPGPVAAEFTQVRKTTAYGPTLGYGWGDPSKADERDRGSSYGDALTQDFCLVNGTPFYVDIPDGHYRVTCIVGDGIVKSGTTIRANGLFEIPGIGADAGKYATNSFPIDVIGGRLRFEFSGSVNHINAIIIQPMSDAEWNRPTIFLAGDSTVADYAPSVSWFIQGWGQSLPQFFTSDIVIDNQSKGGRSSRSFYDEGSLAVCVNRMKPGDYLFVMFAINDSADESPNYRKTSPATTFKAFLRVYVDAARSKGAIPVFVTSQIKCTYDLWGRFFNSVQGYPQAMRELGAELNVPVIDLNRMSIDDLTEIKPPEARSCYATWPDGRWDYIHLNSKGATRMAALVAKGVKDANLSIAQYLIAPPSAPTNVTATAVSTTEIALAWNTTPRASSYNVKRASTSGGPYSTVATDISGTSLLDAGLAPGTTYYYVVSAVNVKGESADSAETSATTFAGPPAAPTALRAVAGNSQVTLTWNASAGASSYSVKRSNTSGTGFATIADTTNATYRDESVVNGSTYYYVVSARNAYGESASSGEVRATPATRALAAHWKFDEGSGTTTADSSGSGWNGVLVNGALWTTNGAFGNAVDLDGSNDYVSTPPGLVSSLTDFTVSAWFSLDSAPTWSRIFDFGSGINTYMFLTPYSSTGTARFAITTGTGAGEQQINGTAPLPIGGWHHVAVTLAGGVGVLYVDGVEVARNSAMTLTPASLGNTTQNWIGRSQWNDPYLNGRVDEFRIYNTALTAAEIASLADLDNTAPTLSPIADQTVAVNGSTGPISFTVGDAETAADSLILSASSSDQTLVPNANIVFGGNGNDRTVTVTPAANQSGAATITIAATDGALNTTTTFNLAVLVPPAIATQPQSQTVTVDESVTFTVSASGSGPFSYEWQFNGAAIAGATDTSYTIASAQLADAGNYSVRVANAVGSATSAAATLTVNVNATFSGQATVLNANVLGITNAWSDTGALPPEGGMRETSLLTLSEPGLFVAAVAHASVIGQADRTRAEAATANVALSLGGVSIGADFVMARAQTVWQTNGTAVSGSSEIARLVVNGLPVAVTGQTNQVVPLLNGQVIINEQTRSTTNITVNALHLVITGVADVVVSSAHAGLVSHEKPTPTPADYVTGGGWITGTPSGAKGNFGLSGGFQESVLVGHLTYQDHGNGMKVQSTGITAYQLGATANSRRIEGTAEVDGIAGFTFTVEVTDNGNPGKGNDVFTLSVSNGYQASGTLGGGNIQLHQSDE